tara:strand:+ start:241 stop:3870 length:3630 start_codon:yes stop_codon:yes gene_type:complete
MATSDLLNELSNDGFKPDSDGERKICKTVLKLLSDQSSDVQGLAVKCLSPLVRKVHELQVQDIMVQLVQLVLTGKEEQRDISSIGLKTVVLEMPQSMGAAAIRQLSPQLVSGVSKDVLEVKLECMDILNDLLKRFGTHMKEEESDACLAPLFKELGSARAAARKRAIACIASLSAALPDKLLGQLVASIVSKMDEKGITADLRRTYIQTLSAISRSGGYRLGKQLELVVPLVLQQCSPAKASGDAEMCEACLQAFDSFVLRCPKEAATFQAEIAKTALQYISYDPNYDDDMDEDQDEAEDEDEEMEDDDDDGADYSDDDDVSWKVRRAAAKVLSAIIISSPAKLAELFPEVAPVLIGRFKEREENVKMDVFATFNDLLQQVAAVAQVEASAIDAMAVDGPVGTSALLQQEVPRIVKAVSRQLKEKSVKTRVAGFHCLRQLVTTLPGCLAQHSALLVPGIDKALKDASSNNLRIEALVFLQIALASHPPAVFQPHLAALQPPVIALVSDRYYKITAEALRVAAELVKVMRPEPPKADFDFKPYVAPMFACAKARLQSLDQDQEVKECAISCMGLVLSHLGDACAAELPAVLPILLERLRNEITRVTTVKTFQRLASATMDMQLGPVLQPVVAELCSFLRKASRPLRQTSLAALETIVSFHGAQLGAADIGAILDELPVLITDADLHVAHLALSLAKTVVATIGAPTVAQLKEKVLPKCLSLLHSSLLQGVALRSLLALFAQLVRQNLPGLTFTVLIEQLLGSVAGGMSKHSLAALSQAVATCCTHAPEAALRDGMVTRFTGQLGALDAVQPSVLALLCLGEIGRANDLSAHAKLLDALMAAFGAASEEVKAAAAFALGNLAAGNLPVYLPHLLKQIQTSSSNEYLMLHALKELISSGQAQLGSYVDQMLPKLFEFAERDEEGVRNVVAECLGKLAAVAPDAVVPALEARLTHASALTRAAVVNSIRFTLTETTAGGGAIPAVLLGSLRKFLATLQDVDLKVRRGALLALNCVSHNKPAAVRDHLPELLPMLYEETRKKAELVHTVDLGPFKHQVDDGLELRKAGFETMDTLLDGCPDRLELPQFLVHLTDGLKDDHDIKLLCHIMLRKLAAAPGSAAVVVASLEAIVEPLRSTICATLKDNAVKQQIERHEELVASGMRTARAIEKCADADTVPKFEEFVRTTLRGGKLAERYNAIVAEDEAKASGADAQ